MKARTLYLFAHNLKSSYSYEFCDDLPFPRVYGADDGDVVFKCLDVDQYECHLGGYTTADSITSRGSTSKAITIILDSD